MWRKTMELMIFWLPIIASILLGGIATAAWYGGNKTLCLWLAFTGLVCMLLTATIQIQQYLRTTDGIPKTTGVPDKESVIAQRAYVSVSDASISDLTGGNAPTVAVTIKNTGVTPAYDLTWRATFTAREFPEPQEIVLDRTKDAPKIVLPPGSVLSYKWTFTDWKSEWGKKIGEGDAAVFAVGEIFYKDVFGNSHFTKYRLIHGGDSMVSPGKFGPAAEGNEAD